MKARKKFKNENNNAAVYVGSSLTVHKAFFLFPICAWINLSDASVGQKTDSKCRNAIERCARSRPTAFITIPL